MAWARIAIVTLLLSTTGCGDAVTPGTDAGRVPDAGAGADAGSEPDAGAGPDAASDAATPTDAAADATALPDSGTDGGPPVSMPCTPTGACDPFTPSPCPDGEACRTGAMGLACYPHDPAPLAEGAPCDAPADCGPGTQCLSFGSSGFTCTRLCPAGSIGACGAGRACTGTISDPCVQACRPIPAPCDIYAQDCTDPEQTCTLTRHPETDAPYTGCRPAGPRAEGETCGGADGTCGHDLICIRTGDVNACRQPCDPDDPTDACSTGQACTGMSRTWMVGYCAPAAP